MTPNEEATFIALRQEGLTSDATAEALGISQGTARSRAYALQQQGKITPLGLGGRRPRTNVPELVPKGLEWHSQLFAR